MHVAERLRTSQMPGLFIIAHAPLASALRDTAMHAFPEAAQAIAVYDVPPGASAEVYEAEVQRSEDPAVDAMRSRCSRVVVFEGSSDNARA